MARDVHRHRRRRRGRVAHRHSAEPAAARHARRQDPPHHSRHGANTRPRARSATTADTVSRTTIRSSSKPGAKKEIWAYGLRNPHRLSWAADPSDARRQHLIAAVIGLRTWEMVSIIRKGANYGYSQREGNQLLQPDNVIAPLPAVDKIAVQIGDEVTDESRCAHISRRSVRARARGRRWHRQRIRLHGQGAAGAARQVCLLGPVDRTRLVRRLERDARGRRRQSGDDGADARSQAVLERSDPRHLHVDRASRVSGTRRQGSRPARPRNRVRLAPCRRAVRARCARASCSSTARPMA